MSSYEKPDFWAQKAKKEGYPARSVYKLQEIDKKFSLIKQESRVMDIGAAPGSWSLWVLQRLAGRGFLASVDLQDIGMKPPYGNFLFIRGDPLRSRSQESAPRRRPLQPRTLRRRARDHRQPRGRPRLVGGNSRGSHRLREGRARERRIDGREDIPGRSRGRAAKESPRKLRAGAGLQAGCVPLRVFRDLPYSHGI